MELIDYIRILDRRKWVIILTTFFTTLVVIIGVSGIPTKYTATTTVRVLTTQTGGRDYVDYNIQFADRLMGTYVKIANSAPVTEELKKSVDPLPKIDVLAIANSELIQITAEDEDPGRAQFAANKLAEILIVQSRQLASSESKAAGVYVVEPAIVPIIPSTPSPLLLISLGAIAGLIAGLGLAFVFENLDTRMYTPKQIEDISNLPVVGDIPDDRRGHNEPGLIVDSKIHAEAFRRLTTNVFSSSHKDSLKTILVTSAVIQDGRSTVTANLAYSIAETSRSVIVIDANLRYPTMHAIFNVSNDVGLSNILNGKAKLLESIQNTVYPRIKVLTSGPRPSNPVELIGSPHMSEIINELAHRFDVVLLDSPSSLSVTDPAVLAPKVDGVLLVVREGWVRREALQATRRHLMTVNANVIGIIANRTSLGAKSRYALFSKPKPEQKKKDIMVPLPPHLSSAPSVHTTYTDPPPPDAPLDLGTRTFSEDAGTETFVSVMEIPSETPQQMEDFLKSESGTNTAVTDNSSQTEQQLADSIQKDLAETRKRWRSKS